MACGSRDTTTKSATSVFAETCPAGQDASCLRHAIDLYVGTERQPDEKRAFAIFAQLCARGVGLPDSSACVLEGIALVNGRGLGADPTRAQQLFREACAADNTLGCRLANLPVPSDRAPTLRDVEHAVALCDIGTALGCKLAGVEFLTGRVVPADRSRGLKLLEQACAGDEFDACVIALGLRLDQPASHAEAVRGIAILDRGCARRHGPSCVLLGTAYANGTSTLVPDEPMAVSFFRRACDAADREGCAALAIHLGTGKGVSKDLAQAQAILEQQCRDGHGPSCGKWGALFLIEHQTASARQAFERGCVLEDGPSCKALEQLAR